MFRQGPIPAFVHGVFEYVVGIFLVAAPFLLGYDADAAIAASIVAGVIVLIIAASTAMSTGLIRSIPVQAHVVLDYLLAIALIAAPFLFGFTDDGSATAVFVALGVLHLLMTIATRFVRDERPPRRRGRPPAEPADQPR